MDVLHGRERARRVHGGMDVLDGGSGHRRADGRGHKQPLKTLAWHQGGIDAAARDSAARCCLRRVAGNGEPAGRLVPQGGAQCRCLRGGADDPKRHRTRTRLMQGSHERNDERHTDERDHDGADQGSGPALALLCPAAESRWGTSILSAAGGRGAGLLWSSLMPLRALSLHGFLQLIRPPDPLTVRRGTHIIAGVAVALWALAPGLLASVGILPMTAPVIPHRPNLVM